MFDLKMSGSKCVVTRKLELPASGPLPATMLESDFTVTLKLGKVKPNSDLGKSAIKTFQNVYRYELDRFGKKQDNEFIADWKKIGAALPKLNDKSKVEGVAKTFQDKVLKNWNTFAGKEGKRYAESSFKAACDDAEKKTREKLEKPSLDYSSEELKSSRVNILTAILGAMTVGTATGGLGWIAAATGGVGALIKGYQGAWDVARKHSGDMQENLAQIDDVLSSANKALDGLKPRIAKLVDSQNAIEAQLLSASNELAKLKTDLDKLENRAKSEQAVAEGKVLADARDHVTSREAQIKNLSKQLASMRKLQQALEAAQAAVAEADKLSTAERNGWDAFMASFSKISSDTNTALKAVVSLLKKL